MKFQPPKGTRDFLPKEMILREYIIQKIKNTFECYGFEPIESPAIENLKILEAKCGSDIKEQIFKFEDKAGRKIGLRFDLTVPLARIVANNPQLPKPLKVYQISRVWRYEEVKRGRKREFWQADIDIIGSDKVDAEVECMACAIDCLRNLGFENLRIRINNRKILDGILEVMGVDREKYLDIFRLIDKLEKVGQAKVISELEKLLSPDKVKKLMKFITIRGNSKDIINKGKKILKNSKMGIEGLNELEEIIRIAKIYNISDLIDIDFSLARGLDYYTGPIFEIPSKIGAIAGGGRYDTLVQILGGRPTPATGISLGIERIAEILKEKDLNLPKTKVKIFIANVNEDVKSYAIKIAQKLRKNGISCQTDLLGRNLTKQLEFANSIGIPYVIIVGPKEIKSKKYKFRDMAKKTEKSLGLNDIVKLVKGNKN